MPLVRRSPEEWLALRERSVDDTPREAVARILEDVRIRGDEALYDWTERLDGVRLSTLRVSAQVLDEALAALDPTLRVALDTARRRIAAFHRATAPPEEAQGGTGEGVATRLVREPLRRVAVYVPAGRAPLPSSLLMGVIPAQVAGVKDIVVLTPPRRDGTGDPVTLAAAALLGIRDVYLIGGAQAIAAAAYGTASLPRVDKIVGPGNRWVTEAKRQLYGVVGIDGLNGPSEVVIWAEAPASPAQVARDLVAQAEHDPRSWALLVTTDEQVLDAVDAAFDDEDLPALQQAGVGVAVVPDIAAAVRFIDRFCPEHLELWGEAERWAPELTSAGATFVGCPTPLGDYAAGPNHVLPTGGTARFASVLGVDDFLRRRTEVRRIGDAGPIAFQAARLAAAEGLEAHRRALELFRGE